MTAGVDPGKLCQLEAPVSDVPRALAFYEAAFGWRPVPAEIHEYVVMEVPEGCPYGLALVPARTTGEVLRGGVVVYFAVPEPEAVVAQVEANGGRKRFGPMPVAGYGQVWQVEDPDGNRWGLFKRP